MGWISSWPAVSKNPVVAELQDETEPGRCVFCGRRVVQQRTRTRFTCFRADCQTAYNSEYQRRRREALAEKGLTQRGTEKKR